jgi:pimeloyl-ACP methyl ester carboxylesterase
MAAVEQHRGVSQAGFKRETLSINGVKTAVLTAGRGEPLVFLHGAGTFHGFDFALPWANRYRVIVPYHPGFGESADDPEITETHDYILHYIELFDQLKLDQVRLVGFSLGGWLAAEFALEHAHRLHRLVLVAPAGLRVPEHPTADVFRIPPEELPSYLVVDLKILAPYLPKEPDVDFIAARYREMTSVARIAWERPYSLKLPRWLHRVRVPTLLVWGDQDRLIPMQQAQAWARLIPGATVEIVKDAGHLVLDEQPQAVEKIAEFLTGK